MASRWTRFSRPPPARLRSISTPSARTLAEEGPTIQPFDQDHWARIYPGIPAALALETFAALRQWNLHMIREALPAAAGRKMTHPERGTMTFLTVVETMAGHDLNHLEQLRKLAGAAAS